MRRVSNKEDELRGRVSFWSERIGVEPKLIQVRKMKTKWASSSSRGSLCFSKDLLKKRPQFRDYVIVHELLHLQVPNHGKLFKRLMDAYLPGWEKMDMER